MDINQIIKWFVSPLWPNGMYRTLNGHPYSSVKSALNSLSLLTFFFLKTGHVISFLIRTERVNKSIRVSVQHSHFGTNILILGAHLWSQDLPPTQIHVQHRARDRSHDGSCSEKKHRGCMPGDFFFFVRACLNTRSTSSSPWSTRTRPLLSSNQRII